MVRELLVELFTGQLRSVGKDLVSFENCQTRLFYSEILFRQENPRKIWLAALFLSILAGSACTGC